MRPYQSLRGRREFSLAMGRGAVRSAPALTLYAFTPRSTAGAPRVGIVVSRKVGNAVSRNLVRRRCKAILESLLAQTDPRWYVIACKPTAAKTAFAELRRQIAAAVTPAAARPAGA